MPTLNLHTNTLLNPTHQAKLARALTAITAEVLGKRPEVTAVLLHAVPAAQWFIGGVAPTQPTVMLQIDITAGTNTGEQKAAFIAAVWAELQHQLGAGQGLAPASYAIVRELPATDWGYGGRTQRSRQLERQPVQTPSGAA